MAMRDWLLRRLPKGSRAAAETESRLWKVVCPKCGLEQSIWDLGGVRYKANRRQLTWSFGRCPSCRRLGLQRVRWRGDAAGS